MSNRAFTDEQAQEIRQRLDEGETTRDLAFEHGVSTTTIKNVRRNLYKAKLEWEKRGPKARPVRERLWEKIDRRREGECWPWIGASRNGGGVPTLSTPQGSSTTAYRILFETEVRELEPGESVLHRCRNPLCMNPDHLYAGSKSDWAKQLRKGDIDVRRIQIDSEKASARARDYYRSNRTKAKAYAANYQLERKLAAVIYKGGKCQGCDEVHPAALQFHHRDPSQKQFAINAKTLSSPNKIPWSTMREELEKCDLLCANCHSKHHTQWTQDMVKTKTKTLEAYGLENIYDKSI